MAAPAYHLPDSWTEADLNALPDDGHRYEILDGSLLVTPLANGYHQSIEGDLYLALRKAAPPEWRVLTNIGVRVPAGNFVPDIAVVRAEADLSATWHDPDTVGLAVEIASKSTEVNDKGNKVIKYAEAGIPGVLAGGARRRGDCARADHRRPVRHHRDRQAGHDLDGELPVPGYPRPRDTGRRPVATGPRRPASPCGPAAPALRRCCPRAARPGGTRTRRRAARRTASPSATAG